jgi:cobalt-zinc-cadmium efflux system outer membrane protein
VLPEETKPGDKPRGRSEESEPALLVSGNNQDKPPTKVKRPKLVVPKGIPGSDAAPVELPKERNARERAVKKLYPELPPLPADLTTLPGPNGKPLTLSDLQSLAAANNPSIKNAAAGVEAARGALAQAGAYPNPSLFWEADTVGTSGAGYQGGGFDQVIRGGNKIKLAKAAATMELRNAELAYRRAVSDLATQVRSTYFAVLVALENVKVNRALARFTDQLYRFQIDLVLGGPAAPYEPIQLRPLVLQARLNLIQAKNQFMASWKQLVAAMGLPNMPPTDLAGRVDLPVPVFQYEDVLARVLNNHTDILTAQNNIQKARYNLELAQVTPVPDFDVNVLIQKDYTTPPHYLVYSGRVTIPVPVWDQNKGAIIQARNLLIQAVQGPTMSQLQLTTTLADAFNRYTTARQQVQATLQQIKDQVRAFRGVYERRGQAPDDVSFGDVVAAQQTLAGYISAYITALGGQWTAVVDVANLLQTDDLFQVGKTLEQMAPVPNLEELTPVPGCYTCRPCPRPEVEAARRLDTKVIQGRLYTEPEDPPPEDAAPKRKKVKRHPRHTEPSCVVLTPEAND